jgi:hypothetical protein
MFRIALHTHNHWYYMNMMPRYTVYLYNMEQ